MLQNMQSFNNQLQINLYFVTFILNFKQYFQYDEPPSIIFLYLYIKMLKGIKIKKVENKLPEKSENLLQELQAAHTHLFQLFAEGYPDTKPSVEKIHELENKYFKQLMSGDSTVNNVQTKQNQQKDYVKQSEVPMRVDHEIYEQVSNKKVKKFKFFSNKKLESCLLCPENDEVTVLSTSSSVFLAIAKRKQFVKYFHLYICPIQHVSSSLALEPQTVDEINNFKKCLIQMFDSIDYHPVFFETYTNRTSHLCIQCLAVPSKRSGDFPFYFKQGLQGCEGEWGTNKNIIQIKKQRGGLLKQIPRNFRYFYIDFSLGYGYAHIIEDQKSWNPKFCLEIIASVLGMQKHEVLTTQQYSHQQLNKRIVQFNNLWKGYDWTGI